MRVASCDMRGLPVALGMIGKAKELGDLPFRLRSTFALPNAFCSQFADQQH
jgi:hypothetical protein